MNHLSDDRLIALINSGLSGEERRRVEEHLAGCEGDRLRRDALREVWSILGEWDVPARRTDLWPRVETAVGRLEGRIDMSEFTRRRGDALHEVWSALETWELPERRRDLWPEVEEAVRREGRPQVTGRRWAWCVLRTAVAVLLAVAVGHTLGRWVGSRTGTAPLPDADLERVVAESLYLHSLATRTPSGLAEAVLNADRAAEEEVSP